MEPDVELPSWEIYEVWYQASLLFHRGIPLDAAELFRGVGSQTNTDWLFAILHVNAGLAFAKAGDLRNAEKDFLAATMRDPTWCVPLFLIGLTSYASERFSLSSAAFMACQGLISRRTDEEELGRLGLRCFLTHGDVELNLRSALKYRGDVFRQEYAGPPEPLPIRLPPSAILEPNMWFIEDENETGLQHTRPPNLFATDGPRSIFDMENDADCPAEEIYPESAVFYTDSQPPPPFNDPEKDLFYIDSRPQSPAVLDEHSHLILPNFDATQEAEQQWTFENLMRILQERAQQMNDAAPTEEAQPQHSERPIEIDDSAPTEESQPQHSKRTFGAEFPRIRRFARKMKKLFMRKRGNKGAGVAPLTQPHNATEDGPQATDSAPHIESQISPPSPSVRMAVSPPPLTEEEVPPEPASSPSADEESADPEPHPAPMGWVG